jgi:methionine synthase I (cobalamin-dependent)
VTDVTDRAYDTDLLDTLSKRVMVGDGAMGTQLLNETWPDAVETKYVRLQSG